MLVFHCWVENMYHGRNSRAATQRQAKGIADRSPSLARKPASAFHADKPKTDKAAYGWVYNAANIAKKPRSMVLTLSERAELAIASMDRSIKKIASE